jgi:hypothetical protein
MQLKPQVRQQLTLLLQRQHLEEQELRLRHWMELEKFHKGLGKEDLLILGGKLLGNQRSPCSSF